MFYVDAQNFYHHGVLYALYILAYGGSTVFFLVQIGFACRAYQYTGGTQLLLATLFVLLGLMVQLFLPMVKIDWLTITCGALMMSKFSSDMVLQTDGLTQLVNRLGYEHYLARLRVPATILMFDVDRFKDVNDVLNDATADLQPPATNGRRLKIYYITQQSACPPTFILFVNEEALMHFAYQRYLENYFRKTFDFTGTPIRFILREKTKEDK